MKKERIEEIYEFLKGNDYISTGNIIESDVLMPLIGCTDVEDLQYIGPLILIVKYIESKGYFCKISEGCIRIYTSDECPEIAKRRQNKARKIQENTLHTLTQVDLSDISDRENRHKAIHAINLLSMLNRSSKVIYEQTRYYEYEID